MDRDISNYQMGLFLATPAIMRPGMTEEEWARELQMNAQRSQLTRDFCEGKISPADYECGLAELGRNPYDLIDLWEEGLTLL